MGIDSADKLYKSGLYIPTCWGQCQSRAMADCLPCPVLTACTSYVRIKTGLLDKAMTPDQIWAARDPNLGKKPLTVTTILDQRLVDDQDMTRWDLALFILREVAGGLVSAITDGRCKVQVVNIDQDHLGRGQMGMMVWVLKTKTKDDNDKFDPPAPAADPGMAGRYSGGQ